MAKSEKVKNVNWATALGFVFSILSLSLPMKIMMKNSWRKCFIGLGIAVLLAESVVVAVAAPDGLTEAAKRKIIQVGETYVQHHKVLEEISNSFELLTKFYEIFSWMETNRTALEEGDSEYLVDPNLPGLVSAKEIRAAVEEHLSVFLPEYRPLPTLPKNFPVSATSIYALEALLSAHQQQVELFNMQLSQLDLLYNAINENLQLSNRTRGVLDEMRKTPGENIIWGMVFKHVHVDLVLSIIPEWAKARTRVKKLKVKYQKFNQRSLDEMASMILSAETLSSNARHNLSLLRDGLVAEMEKMRSEMDAVIDEALTLGDKIAQIRQQREAMLVHIGRHQDAITELEIKINRLKEQRIGANRDLSRVRNEIAQRPNKNIYDCGGNQHHNNPRQVSNGDYVCNTEKTIETRERWDGQDRRKANARARISSTTNQIKQIRVDIREREKALVALEESESKLQEQLNRLQPQLPPLQEKAHQAFGKLISDVRLEEVEEMLAAVEESLQVLETIKYEIGM